MWRGYGGIDGSYNSSFAGLASFGRFRSHGRVTEAMEWSYNDASFGVWSFDGNGLRSYGVLGFVLGGYTPSGHLMR